MKFLFLKSVLCINLHKYLHYKTVDDIDKQ